MRPIVYVIEYNLVLLLPLTGLRIGNDRVVIACSSTIGDAVPGLPDDDRVIANYAVELIRSNCAWYVALYTWDNRICDIAYERARKMPDVAQRLALVNINRMFGYMSLKRRCLEIPLVLFLDLARPGTYRKVILVANKYYEADAEDYLAKTRRLSFKLVKTVRYGELRLIVVEKPIT